MQGWSVLPYDGATAYEAARKRSGAAPAVERFSPDVRAGIEKHAAERSPDASTLGGKINLLNPAEIREGLGGKWPRYAERVHNVVSENPALRLPFVRGKSAAPLVTRLRRSRAAFRVQLSQCRYSGRQ